MNNQKKILLTFGITICIILLLTAVWLVLVPQENYNILNCTNSSASTEANLPQEEFETTPEEQTQSSEKINVNVLYPVGELIVTTSRKDYVAESMKLVIPKLKLSCLVQNGTDEKTLQKGPGLYEYAQLPSTNNSNVSIAGHRDIYGSHFYYLDTLKENDRIYLIYNDEIYEYQFLDSKVYDATNWDPIRCKDISCVTLTTCDPIGTSLNRLIVTAQLIAVYPYFKEFEETLQ